MSIINNLINTSSLKKILKGGGISVVGKLIAVLLTFTFNVLVARIYSAEQLGELATLISALDFCSLIIIFGTDTLTLKLLPIFNKKEEINNYFEKINSSVISISLIIITIFIALNIYYDFASRSILIFILISVILYPFHNLLKFILRALHKELKFFIAQISNQSLLVLSLCFIYFFGFKLDIIIVYILALAFSFLLNVFINIKTFHFRAKKLKIKEYKELYAESFPFFLTASTGIIISKSDILILNLFTTQEQIGYYHISIKLGFILTIFFTSINKFIGPVFSKLYHANQIEELLNSAKKTTFIIFLLSLPPALLLLFFGENILMLFFGKEFSNSYVPMVIIIISQIVNVFFGSVGVLLDMSGNQKFVFKATLISAIANVVLNFILMPFYGILGAAIATLFSVVLNNLMFTFACKNIFGESIYFKPNLFKKWN
ncbi:oligosaccharide flippase family protein [bacterium]|jgi:O-antigen/teichoic acid export membrane protein|nr:oligosaccharide flippase family protein [bacterium]